MGWIIFGGIVLLIAALLASPAVARFEYGEELRLRVSWLFITLFSIPARTKKAKKRDRKAKKAARDVDRAAADTAAAEAPSPQKADDSALQTEKKAERSDKPAENKPKKVKPTLSELFELVKALLDSLGTPLKKLLHRTKIAHLRVNVICGGEDAAQAALNFGKTNILVGNILG